MPQRFAMATALLTTLLACACSENNGPGDCPEPEPVFSLPADEAPHIGMMEWWYYTGHLWTQEQRRYGFEVSFFQVATVQQATYMGHFAISDSQAGLHHYDQRLTTEPQIFPHFDLALGDWTMSGTWAVDRVRTSMDGFAIDLEMVPLKPPAIHNRTGLIAMGGGMDSYYYSKTRLEVTGTLTVGDADEAVTGMAWMDHQWGDYEVFASDGWDWFSVQLDDQTEIMIFLLHFKDQGTQLTGATFVDADGCQHPVSEVAVESHDSWESPVTGPVYPLDWHVSIPALDIQLDIVPAFPAQEMNVVETTFNVYWEGETRISGTRAGKPVEGFGYVELCGYGTWGP